MWKICEWMHGTHSGAQLKGIFFFHSILLLLLLFVDAEEKKTSGRLGIICILPKWRTMKKDEKKNMFRYKLNKNITKMWIEWVKGGTTFNLLLLHIHWECTHTHSHLYSHKMQINIADKCWLIIKIKRNTAKEFEFFFFFFVPLSFVHIILRIVMLAEMIPSSCTAVFAFFRNIACKSSAFNAPADQKKKSYCVNWQSITCFFFFFIRFSSYFLFLVYTNGLNLMIVWTPNMINRLECRRRAKYPNILKKKRMWKKKSNRKIAHRKHLLDDKWSVSELSLSWTRNKLKVNKKWNMFQTAQDKRMVERTK